MTNEEMTKEEAVKRLKEARSTIQPFMYVDEAIDYAVKILEQESCEDVIIDKHYWKGFNNGIRTEQFRESKRQESCEDAISRQAVLKEQYRIDDSSTLSTRDVVNVEDIEQLPSVTPTEKIGQWVFNDTAKEHAHCSECGYGNVDLVNGKPHNYCENCGAKMKMAEG